jgi:hypothetical protein
MADKFLAEMVTRTEFDRSRSRLEISFSDIKGSSQVLSFGADAIAALTAIFADVSAADPAARERLTKMPKRYAVGHGRHEPLVMLRFEDDAAYGLSPSQATAVGEALLEEAEALSDIKYLMRQ